LASGQELTMVLRATEPLSGKFAAAQRKAGKNPADYRCLGTICFPLSSAAWIDAQAEALEAEREAARRDPANIARNQVHDLFDRAKRYENYPGEYYPMMQRARAALAAWRQQYSAAARAEDRQALLVQAGHLDDLASGALVYDADGLLGPAEQQRRHDEFKAQADAKRAEAEALK